MGQPTFSSIPYEYAFSPTELYKLKDIKEPNLEQREYWLRKLTDNQNEVVDNWNG